MGLEDGKGRVCFLGLTEHKVDDLEDVLDKLNCSPVYAPTLLCSFSDHSLASYLFVYPCTTPPFVGTWKMTSRRSSSMASVKVS